PILQQLLVEGADIVIHSATKYLGGHNDVVAGLIAARGQELCVQISFYHNEVGATLVAFVSWLLIRGMKTLALRMNKNEENAKQIVTYLQEHDCVTDVIYPGKGGMLSFRVKKEAWVNTILQQLTLISFAESLGGVESFMT